MPEISVVIPSYNHADFIAEAVESVLQQTFQDLELIVVDDGSSDNSLDILSVVSDPRMTVISQTNQGAHAAINRGLQMARGGYLAILNSDDAYHPQRLEKILLAFNSQPNAGLAGSYIQIVDRQGKPSGVKHGYLDCPPWLLEHPERSFRAGEDLNAALLTENFWSTTSNFVFSRTLYKQVGDFLPLRYAHDWDFALRAAHVAPSLLLPEPLIRYRVHPNNTIRENQAAMIFEICWILAVHLPRNTTLGDASDPQILARSIEQLLHSIYVYDMERLLSVMLLQDLDQNQELAQALLEPGNPVRFRYMTFIEEQLDAARSENPLAIPSSSGAQEKPNVSMVSQIRRVLGRFRSIIE